MKLTNGVGRRGFDWVGHRNKSNHFGVGDNEDDGVTVLTKSFASLAK